MARVFVTYLAQWLESLRAWGAACHVRNSSSVVATVWACGLERVAVCGDYRRVLRSVRRKGFSRLPESTMVARLVQTTVKGPEPL